MELVSINPGIRTGVRQPYTVMYASRIFFLTHNESTGEIAWNMFMDDLSLKKKVEGLLLDYLTN